MKRYNIITRVSYRKFLLEEEKQLIDTKHTAPRGMLSQEFISSDVVSGGPRRLVFNDVVEYLVLNVVGEHAVGIPGHPPPLLCMKSLLVIINI